MNNIFAHGTGGVFVKPSARRSIHDHWGCLFAEGERMARFGLTNNGARQQKGSSEENRGADEVDNAWSQPAHPIRSSNSRKKRRSSLDTMNDINGQHYAESDDDVLSKSVPATLPSRLPRLHYSYQSEDDDDETLRNDIQNDITPEELTVNNVNMSNCSYSTPSSRNSSRNYSTHRIDQRISDKSFDQDKNFVSKATVPFISVVVILCAVVCSGGINLSQMNAIKYDKSNFFTEVSGLGEKYNVDSNSILQVQMGIATIFDREDAGSFIFAYNSKADNFDSREFNGFVNDMSYAAAKFLRNESAPQHFTIVDGAKLDMDEHSELICRYREQLVHTGVMLLRNLEAVPSSLAMAFHYYCDEYNPLVKKTAMLFTLDLGRCQNVKPVTPGSLHSTIEMCLKDKWRSITAESIDPLLARVVSVVIDLSTSF